MSWFGWFRKSNGPRAGGDASRLVGPLTPREQPSAPPPPAPVAPPDVPAATAQEVRRQLFDAVAAGDDERLEALCREHKHHIMSHLPGWLEVPEVPAAFRASPEAYEWYGKGLREIARFCANKLGDETLLDRVNDSASQPTHRH